MREEFHPHKTHMARLPYSIGKYVKLCIERLTAYGKCAFSLTSNLCTSMAA